MAHLEVIYDPAKQMAAVVNVDEQRSWGPAMIGPDAGEILQTWVTATPFDVSILADYDACQAFASFLQVVAGVASDQAPTPPDSPLEPSGGPDLDGAALAQREAADGGAQPPEPQPADTDMEADQGAPPSVVTCPLCSGEGSTNDGADGARVTCAMCGGAKVVRMAVPS